MSKYINVAIAGATGYIGLELIKLLVNHPKINIKSICARESIGKSIDKYDSSFKNKFLPKISRNFRISSAFEESSTTCLVLM